MILRTAMKTGIQRNEDIGNHYSTILKGISGEAFETMALHHFGKELPTFEKDLFGFIETGNQQYPLFVGNLVQILTNDGTVFETLSRYSDTPS